MKAFEAKAAADAAKKAAEKADDEEDDAWPGGETHFLVYFRFVLVWNGGGDRFLGTQLPHARN